MMLYFWGVTGLVFVVGATVFLRLRPHFADIL
jgi:lipopolysaccharide transport system permease protein/teichoic acid transport system permease protein